MDSNSTFMVCVKCKTFNHHAPMQIAVGVGVFFLVCRLFKVEEYQEIKEIAEGYLKKKKNKNC